MPLGGSNALGSWGYLQAAHELLEQLGKGAITDIVMVGRSAFAISLESVKGHNVTCQVAASHRCLMQYGS